MRCFEYARMDLVGSFRSYFGGLLCVAWSPDAKYVLCGGEDDLITLWSVSEKRVVARGQGHNSWVNCVQFDPYLCCDGGYRLVVSYGLSLAGGFREGEEGYLLLTRQAVTRQVTYDVHEARFVCHRFTIRVCSNVRCFTSGSALWARTLSSVCGT